MSRIVVAGGGGAMGRIIVRDLAETAPASTEIVVVDRDGAAAARAAAGLRRQLTIVEADVAKPRALRRVLTRGGVTINACHHSLNMRVMDAAIAVGSHYCDLGGLFHVTREQLQRHREFRAAGLLAVCGIGSAPGIVNVMARAGADRLDRVDEIHIAVGTIDRARRTAASPLQTSYTIETVLDEASLPAAIFTGGRLQFVEPLSHGQRVRFPPPVGVQYPACTIHSELATLPASFRPKGVQEVSFRIAFPGGLTDRLRLLTALGLTSTDEIDVRGRRVVPRDVLRALLQQRQPPPATPLPPPEEYEILRVRLTGTRARRRVEDVLDCHVPGMPAWGVGVDIDTGAPPSIAAQMLLDGTITARGVLAPEAAITPEPFFRELSRRRMPITRRTRRR
jgi:saccharopine dehydrogenase-like NADP-dependent oxidoreductase